MRDNPIQFAVVREDYLLEAQLIAMERLERIMMIGSGGCTVRSQEYEPKQLINAACRVISH